MKFKNEDLNFFKLIGLLYPIENAENNQIVWVRTIKEVYHISNMAALAISLTTPALSFTVLSYTEIEDLHAKQDELSKYPILD